MALIILRCIFTLALAGLAVSIINSSTFPQQPQWLAWAVMGGLLSLAGGVVAIDLGIRRKQLDVISSVYFGLIVGMFLAYIAQLVIKPLIPANITETSPGWIWVQHLYLLLDLQQRWQMFLLSDRQIHQCSR